MATSTVPLALAIMAHPRVRNVNDAKTAITVFASDFANVLWANSAGARLFDLPAPGPQDGKEVSASTALRQVRASRRMLDACGNAAAILRPKGRGLKPPLRAAISRFDEEGPLNAFVLVVVDMADAANNGEKPVEAKLLAEAGEGFCAIRTGAASRSTSGAERLESEIPSQDVVDAFVASGEPHRVIEFAEGAPLIMTRVGEKETLLWTATLPEPAVEAVPSAESGPEKPAESPATPSAPVAADPNPPLPRKLRSAWGPPPSLEIPFESENNDESAERRAPPATVGATDDAAATATDPLGSPPHTEPDNAAADGNHLEETAGHNGFTPRFEGPPVRFVWRIGDDGTFRSVSPEFCAAVGPVASDIVGHSFKDVAHAFGFDEAGDVAGLLDGRDTWSGRIVHWPVDNSDKRVPVDLAALPVYARDRSFDGFRGFGIARLNEPMQDSATHDRLAKISVSHNSETDGEAANGDARTLLNRLSANDVERPFGRRDPAVAPAMPSEPTRPQVIRLEDRRKSKEIHLSREEADAFIAIGEELGDEDRRIALEAIIAGRAGSPYEDGMAAPSSAPLQNSFDSQDGPVFSTRTIASDALLKGRARIGDASPARNGIEDDGADFTHARKAQEASSADAGLNEELATVYGGLPLPVLVQNRESLVYANREFIDLAGDATIEALNERGGLASLFADGDDAKSETGEMTLRRATGDMLSVRTRMQRSTIAGRSCLVMSFFASPSAIAATIREDSASQQPQAGPAETTAPVDGDSAETARTIEDLKIVLATATSGVVLLEPDGMIRSMNDAAHALFGLPLDDVAGRPFLSLFAHESQKAAAAYLESLRLGHSPVPDGDGRELIGRVAEGGFVPLAVKLGRLPGTRGWCAVVRDVAAHRRIKEELDGARRSAEAASLQKSQFLANVSHELRTPLNAIIGFADVISSESFGPVGNERYLEYLDDIKRSGHHVLDLVNDLLDISKIEAGKLDLHFDAVALNEVVGEVVALMQPQANRERVIVRSNLPSSVPPVVADDRSIRQITMNLVSNAIRFTPSGGQIIVSTGNDPDGAVVLRVRDSGIGMSEDEIDTAMLPFQQVNPSQFRRGEGTGLGLPLTKALVEANRAGFAISSTPGEGTLVEISFPAQRVLGD